MSAKMASVLFLALIGGAIIDPASAKSFQTNSSSEMIGMPAIEVFKFDQHPDTTISFQQGLKPIFIDPRSRKSGVIMRNAGWDSTLENSAHFVGIDSDMTAFLVMFVTNFNIISEGYVICGAFPDINIYPIPSNLRCGIIIAGDIVFHQPNKRSLVSSYSRQLTFKRTSGGTRFDPGITGENSQSERENGGQMMGQIVRVPDRLQEPIPETPDHSPVLFWLFTLLSGVSLVLGCGCLAVARSGRQQATGALFLAAVFVFLAMPYLLM